MNAFKKYLILFFKYVFIFLATLFSLISDSASEIPRTIKTTEENNKIKYINPAREFFDGPFPNEMSAQMIFTDLETNEAMNKN